MNYLPVRVPVLHCKVQHNSQSFWSLNFKKIHRSTQCRVIWLSKYCISAVNIGSSTHSHLPASYSSTFLYDAYSTCKGIPWATLNFVFWKRDFIPSTRTARTLPSYLPKNTQSLKEWRREEGKGALPLSVARAGKGGVSPNGPFSSSQFQKFSLRWLGMREEKAQKKYKIKQTQ